MKKKMCSKAASPRSKSLAKLVKEKFVGKTISSVNTRAVNQWDFTFSDGTKTSIEVESVYPTLGIYGFTIVQEE